MCVCVYSVWPLKRQNLKVNTRCYCITMSVDTLRGVCNSLGQFGLDPNSSVFQIELHSRQNHVTQIN